MHERFKTVNASVTTILRNAVGVRSLKILANKHDSHGVCNWTS